MVNIIRKKTEVIVADLKHWKKINFGYVKILKKKKLKV